MYGRGRRTNNIFIKRRWRSLKHEVVYLLDLADGFHARRVIRDWMAFYKTMRHIPRLAAGRRRKHTYRETRS